MRIVVHLEGGLVQSVSSDTPLDAEVVVIDYDTEGVEPEEIHKVPQSDEPADVSDAFIGRHDDVGTTDRNIVAYLDKIA